jgi:hypothetical protein
MTIRGAVADFAERRPLPAEDDATQEGIELLEGLLNVIAAPVSDEEAQALLGTFGPDGCFGLAWSVLHLIESAPSALSAEYSQNSENEWVKLLEERRGQ